jgi:hypothetical protein
MQDNLSMLVCLTQQIMERGKELIPILKNEEKNILAKIKTNVELPINHEFEYLLKMYIALEFLGASKNNFKELLKEYEKIDFSRVKIFQDLYLGITRNVKNQTK